MRTITLSVILLAFAALAAAQNKNGPLKYDKPGDRDDSVHITEGPRVMNVSANSATIEWKTNKNGANHIRFGLDPNRPDKSKYIPGGSKEHALMLTGLQPGHTYYFHIMERDGEVRQGGSGSFTTPGGREAISTPHKDRR